MKITSAQAHEVCRKLDELFEKSPWIILLHDDESADTLCLANIAIESVPAILESNSKKLGDDLRQRDLRKKKS